MKEKIGTCTIALLLLLAGSYGFAAGNSEATDDQNKEITITYGLWGSTEEIEIQKQNALHVSERFPGVRIEVQSYPDSVTFWNKLPAEIAARTAPDIVKLTNEGYFEYVEKGIILPIDEEVRETGMNLDIFSDSAVKIWTVEDKLYGIPLSVAPAMFFINKDMWAEAGLGDYPKTLEEVKAAARILTKDDVTGLIFNDHEYHLTNYVLSYGGGWNNGKTINSDENVMGIQFLVDMFEEGLAITPKQLGLGWDGESFAQERGAMSTGGWWYIGYLKEAAPDLNYEILPMPEGTMKGSTMHSDGLVVLKGAKDVPAAVQAIAYLSRIEAQQRLMEEIGSNPAISSLSDKYYETNPATKSVQPMVEYARDFGYPADTKRFADLLVGEFDKIILGVNSNDVKTMLDEVQQQFK